jgi:V/A-type H+-transporting ATPase subunit E
MMKSEDPNIQALSRAVLRDAHSDAEKVLAEAKEKSDAILQHAQEQAAAMRAEILEQANREAQRIHGELISTAQLKARMLQLEQREKLLDEVFETAHRQLSILQQGTDYDQIACRLLREALSQLCVKEARARTDQVTREFLTDEVLADVSRETGVRVQLGTSLEQGLGVIAETLDGHRQYDNTFEARLFRLQDTLRLPIYHLLMGEPL